MHIYQHQQFLKVKHVLSLTITNCLSSGQCSAVGASAGWEGPTGAEFWAEAERTTRGATAGAQGPTAETGRGAHLWDTATPATAEQPPGAAAFPAPGTGEMK